MCTKRSYNLNFCLILLILLSATIFTSPTQAVSNPQTDPAAQCDEGHRLFLEGKVAEAQPLLEIGFENRNDADFAAPDDLGLCALVLGLLRDGTGERNSAIKAFTVALEVFRTTGNRPLEGVVLNNLAGIYDDLGNYTKALEYYLEALIIFQEIEDRYAEGVALNGIGGVYYDLNNYNHALQSLQEALIIQREVADRVGEGDTLLTMGEVYRSMGNYQQALEFYQEALIIRQEVSDRLGEGVVLNNLGEVHHRLGNNDQAMQFFENALNIHREINNRVGEGTTLINLGATYSDLGDNTRAIQYIQDAMAIFRELDNQEGEGETYNILGVVYSNLGDYTQALQFHEDALLIFQAIGDQSREGDTLGNLAGVYHALGDYAKALRFLQDALVIFQSIGDKSREGIVLNNMGGVYSSLGNYTVALQFYRDALLIFQTIGDRNDAANTLNNLGSVSYELGNYEQALQFYQEALVILQEIGAQEIVGATLNNMGEGYRMLGDHEQAIKFLQEALVIFKHNGDRSGEAATLHNLGLVSNDLDEYEQGLQYLADALAISQEIGNREGEGDALRTIGFSYKQLGDFPQAISYYQQAIEILESIRGSIQIDELKTSYSAEKVGVYEQLIGLLWDENRYSEAFKYIERARARTFLDQLANRAVDFHTGADAKLLSQERVLYNQIAARRAQLIMLNNSVAAERDNEAIAAVEEELNTLEGEYTNFLTQIKLQSPEIASLVSVDVASLDEVQVLLDADTTLLEYFVTTDRILIFIITHNAFDTVTVDISRDDLAQAIVAFRDFASLDTSDLASLQQLHAWLITPLKDKLKTSIIGIIPHGVLQYLPFAALTDGQRYMSEDYTLFTLPSASVLRFIQEKRKPDADTILVLGNPNTHLPDLQFAEQEAQTIARLYGTQALVGTDATESALRSLAGDLGILHLAAHGEYNLYNSLFSAIHLASDSANDGRLEVHEIWLMCKMSAE